MTNVIYTLLSLLFGFLCVFLILLILIQKGRGGGLSGAFGGAGGNTAFGTKTGDLLTWVTAGVFGAFLLLAVGLTWAGDSIYERAMATTPAPVEADEDSGNPLDANNDGEVEVILPGNPNSSLPAAPRSPEPAINPAADGSINDAAGVENVVE